MDHLARVSISTLDKWLALTIKRLLNISMRNIVSSSQHNMTNLI